MTGLQGEIEEIFSHLWFPHFLSTNIIVAISQPSDCSRLACISAQGIRNYSHMLGFSVLSTL